MPLPRKRLGVERSPMTVKPLQNKHVDEHEHEHEKDQWKEHEDESEEDE